MAIDPVEFLELVSGESGDANHRVVGRDVRRTREHHSEIEDHRADSQDSSSMITRVWWKGCLFLLCTIEFGEQGGSEKVKEE